MVLTLELPDSIAQALSVPGDADLSRKALEALAIEGFREKKLSQFQVGQLLGLSRIDAENLLARHADLYDYDHFRRQQAEAVFARLPADEQAAIEALARSGGGDRPLSGPMAATLYKIAKTRLTAERHPDQIPTFEQWRGEQQAA